MATKNLAGVSVDMNEEGYMTNSAQWTKEVAAAIAAEEGVQLDRDLVQGG